MNDFYLPQGRVRLTIVIQAAGDVVRIEDAMQTLGMPRERASKLLSRWAEQGWLRRVGAGIYVPVPVDLLNSEQVLQDPWILVPPLFSPAYIGGRTAAEYWDLTEQIFRDIVVFTARCTASRAAERQGAIFTLKPTRKKLIFGVKTIWRHRTRIAVSDVHRTMLDMLDNPSVGGGIQHVADCFNQYMNRKDHNSEVLIEYALRHGNRAIFKRLGFLAEQHSRGGLLVKEAKEHMSKGHAKLDPALACDRLVTRWRLRVPSSWLS